MIKLLFTTLLIAALLGCEASRNLPSTPIVYEITFIQKEDSSSNGKTHYLIRDKTSRSVIGQVPSHINIDERGVDNRKLTVGRQFLPEWISDYSGSTILITEDCWDAVPENTYLLVRIGQGEVLSRYYVDIPSKPVDGTYPLLPKIKKLTDKSVTVSYSDGSQRSFNLLTLKRVNPV